MIHILFAIHNRKTKTLHCLDCLHAQKYQDFKVVIFDDGSTDGSAEAILEKYPETTIIYGDGNYWWSRSMNAGLDIILSKASDSDYVLTLNDDTDFDDNYLSELIKLAIENPTACIGTVYTEDKTTFEGKVTIDWFKYCYSVMKMSQKELAKQGSSIEGADTLPCRGALIPISVIKEIGVFDEVKLPHYAADYDFFFRAKKHGHPLLVSTKAITIDHNPSPVVLVPQIKKKSLYFRLFSWKSPNNLKNNLIIINRYAPGIKNKISASIRLIIGSPISHFLK